MALAAAPAETYRVGGVKLSPADLAIDFPRELAAYHETITTGELAERLGLSKQRVLQRAQAGELGGVKQRGRWCFPSTAGLPEPADPH
jgi:excisionase family DNA binding protein